MKKLRVKPDKNAEKVREEGQDVRQRVISDVSHGARLFRRGWCQKRLSVVTTQNPSGLLFASIAIICAGLIAFANFSDKKPFVLTKQSIVRYLVQYLDRLIGFQLARLFWKTPTPPLRRAGVHRESGSGDGNGSDG